tara:strand:- start:1226 stop:1483 length:258 start_codon:yes stop_codon:yes gene_type:complete
MKAVNDYVIVENIKGEQKKIAGLILTEETDTENRYKKAKIISCGNLVEYVGENDVVFYDKHAGHDISYNDLVYSVIRARDIVIIE